MSAAGVGVDVDVTEARRRRLALVKARERASRGDLQPGEGVADSGSQGPPTDVAEGVNGRPSESVVEAIPPSSQPSSHLPGAQPITTPDPRDARFGLPGLPDWVTEIRPHQWDAVESIKESFASGRDIEFCDAPTGSGKTLIGELVRREVGGSSGRALYVCHGLTLQDQFLSDFPYAAVLKGRSNYDTQHGGSMVTAADCTSTGPMDPCSWCDRRSACPYEVAKGAAFRSPIAVVNTAYFLAESNHVGKLGEGRELVIADECDVLERELMGFVEFNLGSGTARSLKVTPPAKGSHRKTIAAWMLEELEPAITKKLRTLPETLPGGGVMVDVKKVREANSLRRLRQQVGLVAGQLASEGWVRDNEAGPLVMKPVDVGWAGGRSLWSHGEKWLCMSATIISPAEMAESLGIGEREWGVTRVPMTFPLENRRIHVAPIANMVAAEKDEAWPAMGEGIRRVLGRHPGERVLVHAVSYALAQRLATDLRGCNREVVTYGRAGERDRAVARFRATPGAVLVAPSLDRGVDLKGDDCRVVVVAKVPFPYLGDPQVSARANGPGGDVWYGVQTVRSLVQMTGRHVRSASDWGVTYILDAQFVRNVWKKHRALLPKWWAESVDMGFDTRALMRGE